MIMHDARVCCADMDYFLKLTVKKRQIYWRELAVSDKGVQSAWGSCV
jgi:hypothetical protein